jgi:hypothetical protein
VHAIWSILVEFILRLSCGLAIAMGITPSRQVTNGFFRVHLWVLMGLDTFAALAIYSKRSVYEAVVPGRGSALLALAIGAAVVSYVGAVIWMYERRLAGKIAIGLVALLSGTACALLSNATAGSHATGSTAAVLAGGDWLPGSLVVGSVVAAMLLGHWYLNSPGMRMEPLQRLLLLLAVALLLRALWSGWGLASEMQFRAAAGETIRTQFWLFVALRWLAGIIGPAALTWLTWLTLKIPNTQSATGILYAGVILIFIGELTSRLMSVTTHFPV